MLNTITLTGDNIIKIKQLFLLVPDGFSCVPIKFYVDENGNNIATINVTTIDTSTIHSSKIILDSDIFIPEEVIFKIPLNKITKQILNSNFDTITIDSATIKAESNNKEISTNLYIPDDIIKSKPLTIPTDSMTVFNMVANSNPMYKSNYVEIDLKDEDIKEFIQLRSLLQTSDKKNTIFSIVGKDNELIITASDNIDNKFKYKIQTDFNTDSIKGSFDDGLYQAITKAFKIKEDKKILVSNSFVIISGENNDCEWLIGVQGRK